MRSPLRKLTSAEHASVDRLFSRFDLTQRLGYRSFLAAQAAAHLSIERALDQAGAERLVPDWPQRRRAVQLERDLLDLDIRPRPIPAPRLDFPAEILGAIYVLEGSRLGGAVLSSKLPGDAPSRFLAAPSRPGAWRDLLARLQTLLADPTSLALAASVARACFDCFGRAAERELEPLFA